LGFIIEIRKINRQNKTHFNLFFFSWNILSDQINL
jgi:hypothetical protein